MSADPNMIKAGFSDREKKMILQWLLGGAAVGASAGLASSGWNALRTLKSEQPSSSEDDDTVYLNMRPKTAVMGDSVAIAGSVMTGLGSYKLVQAIYQQIKQKRQQNLLDKAQQAYVDILDEEAGAEKSADAKDKGDNPGLASYILALPILMALGSGVLTHKLLESNFPVTKSPGRLRPKKVVLRHAPAEQEAEQEVKVAYDLTPEETQQQEELLHRFDQGDAQALDDEEAWWQEGDALPGGDMSSEEYLADTNVVGDEPATDIAALIEKLQDRGYADLREDGGGNILMQGDGGLHTWDHETSQIRRGAPGRVTDRSFRGQHYKAGSAVAVPTLDDACEMSLRLILCHEKTAAISDFPDLVATAATGGLQALQQSAENVGIEAALELIKGAADISLGPVEESLGIAILFKDAFAGPVARMLLTGEVAENYPTLTKMASALSQSDQDELHDLLAGLGAEIRHQTLAGQAESFSETLGSLKEAGALSDILQSLIVRPNTQSSEYSVEEDSEEDSEEDPEHELTVDGGTQESRDTIQPTTYQGFKTPAAKPADQIDQMLAG